MKPLILFFSVVIIFSINQAQATAVDNDLVRKICKSDRQNNNGIEEIADRIIRQEDVLSFMFPRNGKMDISMLDVRPRALEFMNLYREAEEVGYEPIGSIVSHDGKTWLGLTFVMNFDKNLRPTTCFTLRLRQL